MGGLGVGLVAVNVGAGGLNCAPTAYGKFKLGGHEPKFLLKFGNAGFSPMFVHKIYYEVDGKPTLSLAPLFKKNDLLKTVDICTLQNPRAWKGGRLVALAVVRPQNYAGADSSTWIGDIGETLKKHNVTVVVTTSVASSGLVCWLTMKTWRLKVVPF